MGEAKRKNTRLYFEALTKLCMLKRDVRACYPKISDDTVERQYEQILKKYGGNNDGHESI